MKRKISVVALTFVALVGSARTFAQGAATQSKPPATAQPSAVNIPVGKVAVIYSAAFQDPKAGITRFTTLLTKLNGEFQKTQDDLSQTAQKIKQLEDEVGKAQQGAAALPPAQIQAKIDQLDQMKKDYQRKGEDAQAAYQKRRQEIFAPLQEDVGKQLEAYAGAHGITMIIDASQVEGILYAADNTDITKAFISEYNSKNPATVSTVAPK
jgi:Skp family chaperone for outer membrane proteins